MKIKNLEVGLRVQVKSKYPVGFYESSAGKLGTIIDIDMPSQLDVQVQYDDGSTEWGNHRGIKRAPVESVESEVQAPSTLEVGSRVRLLKDDVLGFLAGDVGTVKSVSPNGVVTVHFDVARDGWGNEYLGIPDLHGLWVDHDDLEIITD